MLCKLSRAIWIILSYYYYEVKTVISLQSVSVGRWRGTDIKHNSEPKVSWSCPISLFSHIYLHFALAVVVRVKKNTKLKSFRTCENKDVTWLGEASTVAYTCLVIQEFFI